MRTIRLAKTTISSFVFQITTLLCGFVLPRLILQSFGSEVNGLINSITQFLGIIGFLELGVGAVVQSALYKPLSEKNYNEISEILSSAQSFFSKLAKILFVYVISLCIIYPTIVNQDFGWFYTASLIIAMSISSFAQYYFGIVDRVFLSAAQQGYIQFNSQTITLIINTLFCAVLIKLGASIHMVKLTTSLVFLVRPLVLRAYIKRHYNINRNAEFKGEPIKQKWNGVAQHISAVVLDSTDIIVLTLMSNLSEVSVYSVYHLVLHGVKQLLISSTNGIQALLGELWAKKEIDELNTTFGWVEWCIHTGTVFCFGCASVLVIPFIKVYTLGIDDTSYIRPIFAALITLAHSGHCLRLPYNIMIFAGGHYKQTQHCYIIAVIINILISIATVKLWGLVGVAIGTLIAMCYQTIWMGVYISKHLIMWPISSFVKQLLTDIITVILGTLSTRGITLTNTNYYCWFVLVLQVAAVWLIIVILVNGVLFKDRVCNLITKLRLRINSMS